MKILTGTEGVLECPDHRSRHVVPMFNIAPQGGIAHNSSLGFIRNPWSQSQYFYRFLIGGVALVLLGVSWMMSIEEVDKQDVFGATAYYRGRAAKSSWVKVNGRLAWEAAGYEGTDFSGTWYVPMVNRDWEWGDKIKLVVKVSSQTAEDWEDVEDVEGMLRGSLPAFVRKFFEADGLNPSDDAVVLTAGVEPGDDERATHVMIVFGMLMIGGGLLMYDPDPNQASRGHFSRAVPRTLGPRASDLAELRGEIPPDDPNVVAREDAVQAWMREHGLQADELESAEEEQPAEQLT